MFIITIFSVKYIFTFFILIYRYDIENIFDSVSLNGLLLNIFSSKELSSFMDEMSEVFSKLILSLDKLLFIWFKKFKKML